MAFEKQTSQDSSDSRPAMKESFSPSKKPFLARDIIFGIVDTSDRIHDPMAAAFCRNLLEFWIVEAELRGHRVVVDHDIDRLLAEAAQSSARAIVCSAVGSFLSGDTEFFDQMLEWVNKNPSFYVVGHVLDRKDRGYELHEQCFVLNLEVYRSLGRPPYGHVENASKQVRTVVRSSENFHDDYTPHWIQAGEGFRTVTKPQNGHRLLEAGLEAGYRIDAFPEAIRNSKYYFYPTVDGEFSNKLDWWESRAGDAKRAFYAFNTETLKSLGIENTGGPLDHLITLCSGLMLFDLLRAADFNSSTRVTFYDYSFLAIYMMKRLVFDWDGKDYPQFVKDKAPTGIELWSFYNSEQKWREFQNRFGGEEGWLRFFERVKKNCQFQFFEVSVFDDRFADKPFFTTVRGNTLLWLSNVFHYRYSSGMRSLRHRVEKQDSLMARLKAHNPKLLVYMTSAMGRRSLNSTVFRVENYRPEKGLVPQFWRARTSRYPLPLKEFFLRNRAEPGRLNQLPEQFAGISVEDVEKLEDNKLIAFADWIEKQSLLPWLKLDLALPYEAMLNEAQQCQEEFVAHRGDHSGGWSSVCLHGISKDHTEDYDQYGYNNRDEFSYKWTEIADRCPITTQWLKSEWPMEKFDRVRFMLLSPGGYIQPHNDRNGERGLSATNVALNQPEDCEMIFEKYGLIPWRGGDVRRLDVGVNHSVYNGSSENRYHMIIHGRVGDRWRDWNRLIVRSFLKARSIDRI